MISIGIKKDSEKRIAVWGTGAKWRELHHAYPDLPVDFLVDNDITRQGTMLAGLPVKGPQALAERGPATHRVIIASNYFLEISRQLEGMGFQRDHDYIYANRFMEFGSAPLDLETEHYLASHLCLEPFRNFTFHETGDVYTCCQAYLDLPIGNIFHQGWEEIWNSPRSLEIRALVLDGTYRVCSRKCPYIVSRKLLPREGAAALALKPRMGIGPETIGLSCDATCNLSCPSCRPHQILNSREEQKKIRETLEQKIRPMLKGVKSLELLGSGDLFASPSVSAFLKGISRDEFPGLDLALITNGQLMDEPTWRGFANIHGMVRKLSVSLDAATEPTYEKLRRGGRWKRMLHNLAFISDLRGKGHIGHLVFRFVVQADNVKEMKAFVELGIQMKADAVLFSRIVNWGSMTSLEHLSADVVDSRHPSHANLIEQLRDPIFRSGTINIDFDNMKDFADQIRNDSARV